MFSHLKIKSQIPTLVILMLILIMGIWYLIWGGFVAPEGTPDLSFDRELGLVAVGLLAGTLGGLIGTGGCSVMLPVIHFWMGIKFLPQPCDSRSLASLLALPRGLPDWEEGMPWCLV